MAFLLDTNILSDLVRRPRVGLLITFANRGTAHLYEHHCGRGITLWCCQV